MDRVLEQLDEILRERREAAPEDSYVASLHAKGLDKILEKIGEEATETLLAAKNAKSGGDPEEVVRETADLWFHSLVMLSHLDIDYRRILDELGRRLNVSGHAEKAARNARQD